MECPQRGDPAHPEMHAIYGPTGVPPTPSLPTADLSGDRKADPYKEANAALKIPDLVDRLVTSVAPQELGFTTTFVTYSGHPSRLDSADGRRQARGEMNPPVGEFRSWLKYKVPHGSRRSKYAICALQGWCVATYQQEVESSSAAAQLWVLPDGRGVAARKLKGRTRHYPDGLPQFWIGPSIKPEGDLWTATRRSMSRTAIASSLEALVSMRK